MELKEVDIDTSEQLRTICMYEAEHQMYLSEETPSLVAARMDEHRLYILG